MAIILFFDDDPATSVRSYTDKHIKDLQQVYTQILCNVVYLKIFETNDHRGEQHSKEWFRLRNCKSYKYKETQINYKRSVGLYLPYRINHLPTQWASATLGNLKYMQRLTEAVMKEHRYRFGRPGGSEQMFERVKEYTWRCKFYDKQELQPFPITFSHIIHDSCLLLNKPVKYSYMEFYRKNHQRYRVSPKKTKKSKWTRRPIPGFMKPQQRKNFII